jgi:hypothetical protein
MTDGDSNDRRRRRHGTTTIIVAVWRCGLSSPPSVAVTVAVVRGRGRVGVRVLFSDIHRGRSFVVLRRWSFLDVVCER